MITCLSPLQLRALSDQDSLFDDFFQLAYERLLVLSRCLLATEITLKGVPRAFFHNESQLSQFRAKCYINTEYTHIHNVLDSIFSRCLFTQRTVQHRVYKFLLCLVLYSFWQFYPAITRWSWYLQLYIDLIFVAELLIITSMCYVVLHKWLFLCNI